MPFSEPVINAGGTYSALFHSDTAQVADAATIEVTVTPGEWEWTEAGLDALFQTLVDHISSAPEFEFVQANKAQNTSTTVTLSSPPDPAPTE